MGHAKAITNCAHLREGGTQEAAHVLDHHGTRCQRLHQIERRREQIALVALAELLARGRERRARQAARQQIDAGEGRQIAAGEFAKVLLEHKPAGPVPAQRRAAIGVDFDRAQVVEPRTLEAQGLAARTGTQLQ